MRTKIAGTIIALAVTLIPFAGIYAADTAFYPVVSPDTSAKVDVQGNGAQEGASSITAFNPVVSPNNNVKPDIAPRKDAYICTTCNHDPSVSPKL